MTHPQFNQLREAFYNGHRKVVPTILLEQTLTPLALTVWIMDDGAADGSQLRINSQSFRWDECTALAALLKDKFELHFSLNSDKGQPRLRCSAKSMRRLCELIEPYLLPEMRYKLPL